MCVQIPRTAKRPASSQADSGAHKSDAARGQIIEWTTRDRLNISRGMIYALCIDATGFNISCGFAAPRLSLLKHWQVRMRPPYVCPVALHCELNSHTELHLSRSLSFLSHGS